MQSVCTGNVIMNANLVKKKMRASRREEPSSSVEDSVTGHECPAATEAFSNQLVLQQIFMHSDVKSLLEFSLVNKIWCTTARFVLRTHKRCLANLKGINPCEELLQLNHVLTKSTNHPFTGIAMRMNKSRVRSLPVIETDESDSDFSPSEDGCDSQESSDSRDSPYERYRQHYIGSDDSTSSSNDEDEPECINAKVSESYSALLRKLNLRHVEIFWKDTNPTCPAELFLAKLFRVKGDEIKELKIRYLPKQIGNLAENFHIKKSDWLPNLRVLHYCGFKCFDAYINFHEDIPARRNVLKHEIINAAPKLQVVLGVNWDWKHDLRFLVDKKKTGLVKNYVAHDHEVLGIGRSREEKETMVKFASSGVRLSRFSLTGDFVSYDPESDDFKFTKDFLRSLLESSSATLEEIHLDHTHFVHLIPNVLVQTFENLGHMDLKIAPFLDERMGFPILEKFDWSLWFPNVKTIKICASKMECNYDSRGVPEHIIRRIFGESMVKEDFRQRTFGSPCLTATKITFEGGFICKNFQRLSYLRRIFPNLKELVFAHASKLDIVLPLVWTSWPELESINIILNKLETVGFNYDAVFCGISEDQASTAYRKKTVKGLERAKMRPGESSIVSLKCLKNMRIEFPRHKCRRMKLKRGSRSAFLSHVTGLLAFSQMPELTVEIARELCRRENCAYDLEHLRPFVT